MFASLKLTSSSSSSLPRVIFNRHSRRSSLSFTTTITTTTTTSSSSSMTISTTTPTELAYLGDTYAFRLEREATVLDVVEKKKENDNDVVVVVEIALDKTIAYPAGGGQPSDRGVIYVHDVVGGDEKEDVSFEFNSVRMDRETKLVWHAGTFTTSSSSDSLRSKKCTIVIDEQVRMQHAKTHSAGHLLDVAVASVPGLETEKLVPTKGSHGIEEAYVEYKGNARTLSGIEDDEKLIKMINDNLYKLIEKNDAVKTEYLAYEEAKRACGGHLPSYISPDAEELPRIVTVGELGCPCGGTHVKSSKELKRVTVVGLRVKKGATRISYEVDLSI
jgi:Ser-tRNA(Ala) deacylase AlaX